MINYKNMFLGIFLLTFQACSNVGINSLEKIIREAKPILNENFNCAFYAPARTGNKNSYTYAPRDNYQITIKDLFLDDDGVFEFKSEIKNSKGKYFRYSINSENNILEQMIEEKGSEQILLEVVDYIRKVYKGANVIPIAQELADKNLQNLHFVKSRDSDYMLRNNEGIIEVDLWNYDDGSGAHIHICNNKKQGVWMIDYSYDNAGKIIVGTINQTSFTEKKGIFTADSYYPYSQKELNELEKLMLEISGKIIRRIEEFK